MNIPFSAALQLALAAGAMISVNAQAEDPGHAHAEGGLRTFAVAPPKASATSSTHQSTLLTSLVSEALENNPEIH